MSKVHIQADHFASRIHRVERGFTLVELLVVIAVISMLVALLLPSLSQAMVQSKTSKCISNMRGLGQAAFIYAADNKQIMPAQSVFDGATNPARYQGFTAGFGWKALTRINANDTTASQDSGYVARELLLGCAGKTGSLRMANDGSNGSYGFGNNYVHYGYRYNATLLTTTYGVNIARVDSDYVGQTTTNANTPNTSQSWKHRWYNRRIQAMMWDDPTFGLRFLGGNSTQEMNNMIPNTLNWGHIYGGNVVRTDGSGTFVKNAKNDISYGGNANTPSVYIGWPAQSYTDNTSDINPWDARVNNIAGFLDLLLITRR